MTQQKEYHAFISYRHADNTKQGRQWATWLHQAIETYEVPADLVGKKNDSGEEIPARIYPIFRDEEELPAHADLGSSITKALDSSKILVVLCSPQAVKSTYVADEIEHFKRIGKSDKIIAAMIAGEPNTSLDEGKQKAGFSIEDECFPTPLQFEYDEKGNRTTKRAEPIAADFRINNNGKPEQGWTTPEAYRQHLQQIGKFTKKDINKEANRYQQQLHLMLLKIIAGILGVPLSQLTQRDKEYQLEQERVKAKRLKRWLSVVAILAILSIGIGVLAFFKKQEAEHNFGLALLEKATTLIDAKNLNAGHLFAIKALDNLNPAVLTATNKAKSILISNQAYPIIDYFSVPDEWPYRNSVFSNSGKYLAISTEKNDINIVDVMTRKTIGTLKGHVEPIKRLYFSTDEKYLISSHQDKNHIWNLKTGKVSKTFLNYSASIQLSPNGQTLAAQTNDTTIIIVDISSGKTKYTYPEHPARIDELVFSPNGQILASVSQGKSIILWDLVQNCKLRTLSAIGSICEFSQDSKTLAFQSKEGKTVIINLKDNTKITLPSSSTNTPRNIKFSPNGKTLATLHRGELHDTYNLFDVTTGILKSSRQRPSSPIAGMIFSHDSQTFAIRDYAAVILCDVYTGTQQHILKGHNDAIINAIFSPNNEEIATCSFDNKIILWDVKTGRKKSILGGHSSKIYHLDYSTDGKTLTSRAEKDIIIWDLEYNNFKINTIATDQTKTLTSMALSNDQLAFFEFNNSFIELWDIKEAIKKNSIRLILPDRSYIISRLYSSNGKKAIICLYDGTVIYCDLEKSIQKTLREAHLKDPIIGVSLSDDGKTLTIRTYSEFFIKWNLENGKEIDRVKSPEAKYSADPKLIDIAQRALSVSANGQRIAYITSQLNQVTIIDTLSANFSKNIILEDDSENYQLRKIHLSPNGKTLSILTQGTLSFFDVDSGNKRAKRNINNVDEFILSPDERLLATLVEGKTIIIYDIESNREVLRLKNDSDQNRGLAFSPNRKLLATTSPERDNTVTIWSFDKLSQIVDLQTRTLKQNQMTKLAKLHPVFTGIDLTLSPQESQRKPNWPTTHPFHWIPLAEEGDTNAMVQLGKIYQQDNKKDKAISWYTKSMEAGNSIGKERLEQIRK